MGEQDQQVNTGEQVSNTPAGIGLPPEAEFRNINARLDQLADQVSRLSDPPTFRLADMIQLGVIIIGLAIALITAFGLNERISDLSKGQQAAETRITTGVGATEGRLSARLEKLSDQVTNVSQRTANLEGQRSEANRHAN